MDLTPYVDNLRRDLADAASVGGDDARALAERLTGALEAAVRLALLDALSAATDEITRDLAPGSVELRLRGREPNFVVTPPPTDHPVDGVTARVDPPALTDADDGAAARISLRLSEQLKSRIEEAAGRDGISVNAWLVRAAAAAAQATDARQPQRHAPRGGERYVGWVR
jgi:hypothetical protein